MDTPQRAIIAKERMDALKVAYIARERSCSSCRFGPIDGSGRGKCEHFAHWEIAHEALSGRTSLRIPISTAEARSEVGLCGPEGLLFEPYRGWRKVARFYATQTYGKLYLTMLILMGLSVAIVALVATK